MTPSEWARICARMRGWWPQAQVPDGSLALWYEDLRAEAPERVVAALRTFYLNGDDWPPHGGKVLRRIAELSVDTPDFDEVWRLGHDAAGRFGLAKARDAAAWLTERVGLTGANVVIDEWREFCHGAASDRTRYAQTRQAFEQRRERSVRQVAYAGIDPAGLPALERGGPVEIGGTMRKLLERSPIEIAHAAASRREDLDG